MTSTQTKSAITLKGSSQLVTEYLITSINTNDDAINILQTHKKTVPYDLGINSILYQRGIYPPENFKQEERFGLTIFVSTDDRILSFLQSVFSQMKEWLLLKKIQKVSMVITNVITKETLERWDFKLQYEGDTIENDSNSDVVGKKDIKVIQSEIRDVLRQICSTVSFLPLLDCQCAFDLLIYTVPDCEIPDQWGETAPCFIANSQELQLRSFSTSFHKMDTVVSYKAE